MGRKDQCDRLKNRWRKSPGFDYRRTIDFSDDPATGWVFCMERVYLLAKNPQKAAIGGFLDTDEALRMLCRAAVDYDNLQHFRAA